jgi:hypothetical protein
MKKLLLLLLAFAILAPTTAFASDELKPEEYKVFWGKLDAVITDNPKESQRAYADLIKKGVGAPVVQNTPNGKKINYYPVGNNFGGISAYNDSKVSAYAINNVEKNGIIGLASFFKFDMPADFQEAIDHPDKMPDATLVFKGEKLGFGLHVHADAEKDKTYLYDIIVFRDLDLFDDVQKAIENEKN